MKSSIVLITDPDDFLENGFRILLVDLVKNQSEMISQALLSLDLDEKIIVYNWSPTDNLKWLFDKQLKSQLILFNAESELQDLVGYFCAKTNSYYFGYLKSLKQINNSAIYDIEQLKEILIESVNTYGKNER